MAAEQSYLALFAQTKKDLYRHSALVLNAPRQNAKDHFGRMGFPSLKEESYCYIDIEPLFMPDYRMNINRLTIPTDPKDLFQCKVPHMSTLMYYVVNDQFYQAEPAENALPEGVIIESLCQAARNYPDLVSRYYAQQASYEKDSLTAMNTLFAQDGLFIYIPRGVKLEKPLQIVNLNCSQVDLMSHRRILAVLEDQSELRMLVCDHSMDEVRFLTTQVAEIYVGKNASFDLYELEKTHEKTTRFSNLYIRQTADSRVLHNGMTLHNGISRNQTYVTLSGEGAEIHLLGMAICDRQQHIDTSTVIDHAVPHCISNELYKYVLDDEATGAFTGKVLVRSGAQQTHSQQSNKNLCLTRSARVFSQPQLEIYADDVKCGHGSTVGHLDESALFYMQTRGISAREARLMMMFAFVGEVIEQVPIEALRDRLHRLVEKRFRGELNRCKGCSFCK